MVVVAVLYIGKQIQKGEGTDKDPSLTVYRILNNILSAGTRSVHDLRDELDLDQGLLRLKLSWF